MIIVRFLGPAATDFPSDIHLQAASLKDIALHFQNDALASKWLKISAVAINDVIASDISASLNNGDIISILPPVCGG